MIRKILSTALCLLLVLALPLASLAATETTLTIAPGDDIASLPALKDLLDVLAIRVLGGEKSGMLTIALDDTDVLSLAVRADGEGLFAQSAALGERPLYFAKTDVKDFALDAMKNSGMDEKNAAKMEQAIDRLFTGFGMVSGQPATGAASTEQALGKVQEQFANDAALTDFVAGIREKIKVTEGAFTDAAHDPADQMTEISVTSADLLKLADSTALINVMNSSAAQSGMTAEDAMKKFKEALSACDFNLPIAIYTANGGKSLVAIRMPMTVKGTVTKTEMEDGKEETEIEKVDLAMDMAYNLLTVNQVAQHKMSFTVTDEGEKEAEGQLTVTSDGKGHYTLDGSMGESDDDDGDDTLRMKGALNAADGKTAGWLGLLANGRQFTLGYEGQETAEGRKKAISFYDRANATSVIEPAAADHPILTLNLLRKEADETALTAVNAATQENSTQLLRMTGEERGAALEEMLNTLMQTGYAALAKLPASVLKLMGVQ